MSVKENPVQSDVRVRSSAIQDSGFSGVDLLLLSNISNSFRGMKTYSLTAKEIELLRQLCGFGSAGTKSQQAKLLLASGKEAKLPSQLIEVLMEIAAASSSGEGISVISYSKMLTTQEAADVLDVSRPTLIQMLDKYSIAFETVGKHRRISFENVMKLKDEWSKERRRLVTDMRKLSQFEHENFELFGDNPLVSR
jgi:excisionase family DNA binding protein